MGVRPSVLQIREFQPNELPNTLNTPTGPLFASNFSRDFNQLYSMTNQGNN
jgi:hypothetical protein